MRIPKNEHPLTYIVWILLIGVGVESLIFQKWGPLFISVAVFGLTLLPFLFQRWSELVLPRGFTASVVIFIAATLLFGEVFDFYERFFWWDAVLHSGSAIGFGLIGMVLILIIADGDGLKVPPFIGALFAFSFAVMIGAVWEIFEFAMDELVGTNMQKSGLRDTMGDLIVDCIGAAIGAAAGYRYLKGVTTGRLVGLLAVFVKANLDRIRDAYDQDAPRQ